MKKGNRKAVFFRLCKYFLKYKFSVLLAFVLMISSNLFALLGPYLTGKAINAIDLETGVDFSLVYKYCILMAIFYILSSILAYFLSIIMILLSQKIIRKMRQDVFDKILSLPVGYLDKIQAGDIINRISYDIDTVNATLSNDILQALTGIISIIGAAIGMIAVNYILFLIFILTIPLSVLIAIKRSKAVRPLFRKRSAKLALLNGYGEEMISGIKTIKAYAKENEMIESFKIKNKDAVDAYYQADYYGSLIGPSVNFVNNLGTVLITTTGSLLYLYNQVMIGDISSFLLYSKKLSGPINEYANIMGEIQSALAAAERVFMLLDEDEEKTNDNGNLILKNANGDVKFSHVKFAYVKNKIIINDLSFEVKKGQTVAIVGPTGAGKTTLVNLLMRFYDPISGSIKLDNIDIQNYSKESLRAAFSMVLQDTWLFEGTLFENIAYGKENATLDEVKKVVKDANIENIVNSLPNGYDTIITDGGINLSKGQKQLITIARAMISKSQLLILDEATSNVDTKTEQIIHDAMIKLMENKTCFVIAHRLSTIKNADLILVIKNGDIVETGNHQQLLNKKGFYYEIYKAQFQ